MYGVGVMTADPQNADSLALCGGRNFVPAVFQNVDCAFVWQGASRYSKSFRTGTCFSVTWRHGCVCHP